MRRKLTLYASLSEQEGGRLTVALGRDTCWLLYPGAGRIICSAMAYIQAPASKSSFLNSRTLQSGDLHDSVVLLSLLRFDLLDLSNLSAPLMGHLGLPHLGGDDLLQALKLFLLEWVSWPTYPMHPVSVLLLEINTGAITRSSLESTTLKIPMIRTSWFARETHQLKLQH